MTWPWIRVMSSLTWIAAFGSWLATAGFSTDRFTVFFWVITALVAFTLGSRPWWQAPLDWMPFIAFSLAYDYARGASLELGRPVSWEWAIEADRSLFLGVVPTIWLQERLALPWRRTPLWEVPVAAVYLSHFILPFVVAGVLWVRRRDLFIRFIARLTLVSMIGVITYVLLPAAPPWAAARCTPVEVAAARSVHKLPACLDDPTPERPDRTLLPALERTRPGYKPIVQRITVRGWDRVPFLHRTRGFIQSGIDASNPVAAIPSLHGAWAMLVAWFLWPLVRRRWRPLLAAYPLAMGFCIVYGGDHYVVDVLLGWLAVAVATVGLDLLERWWQVHRPVTGPVPRHARPSHPHRPAGSRERVPAR